MAEAKFYTYIHRKADTGAVFYVGKGTGRRAWNKQYRSEFWHRVVAKHGVIVEIVSRFEVEQEAFTNEVFLIAEYKSAGIRLCNATDGGEGPSGATRSDETRKRMSQAMTGLKRSPFSEEARARMSDAAKGRPMSQEAIEKSRAFHTGRKRSQETLDKMSAALKGKNVGRKASSETIAKFIAARKGKPLSEQAKKNISAGHANRTQYGTMSDDHKQKILAGQAAYWKCRREEKQHALDS